MANKYWATRQIKQEDKVFAASEEMIKAALAQEYLNTLAEIERDMGNLYLEILNSSGEVRINELYKYNRYYKMRENIATKVNKLGTIQLNILNDGFDNMYHYCLTGTSDTLSEFNLVKGFDKGTAEVIYQNWKVNGDYWSKSIWASDGKTADARVGKSMDKLQQTLEKGMIDSISRGISKDELVKTLRARFDVSFSEATRLARTELTFVQNQATKEVYKKAGIKQYEYLSTKDSRVSKICSDLSGDRFLLSIAQVGINYPPMHANCRCTTIPVIDR